MKHLHITAPLNTLIDLLCKPRANAEFGEEVGLLLTDSSDNTLRLFNHYHMHYYNAPIDCVDKMQELLESGAFFQVIGIGAVGDGSICYVGNQLDRQFIEVLLRYYVLGLTLGEYLNAPSNLLKLANNPYEQIFVQVLISMGFLSAPAWWAGGISDTRITQLGSAFVDTFISKAVRRRFVEVLVEQGIMQASLLRCEQLAWWFL